MGVLGITRDSAPCGDPVTPATPAPTLKGIWVSGWWLARPGPHADKGSGHSPTPTSSARYTTVSNALNIYFWGNYFLSIVEYTGNLQGNNASKTHFLFFLRKGLVYLLCSVFLNNLWTREAPLIYPSLRLTGCKAERGSDARALEQVFSPWRIWFPPPSPGVGRRGLGASQEGASSGGPSSWAPPLLAYLTLSPEPTAGTPVRKV